MPSANDKFFDLITTRSIEIERLKVHSAQTIIRDLQELEKELVVQLTKIDVTGVRATSYQQQRLKALLDQTRYVIREQYNLINQKVKVTSRQLMKSESTFVADAINSVIGVDVSTVALTTEQIGSLMQDLHLFGSASSKWWDKQSADLYFKFGSEIRKGMFAGETLSDLVRRVRGRRENGFKDGIMQASYRNATALVRTSVQSAANAARDATYKGNDDVLKGVVWVSTLDGRTTPLCIARDHREYTLAHESVGGAPPWDAGPGRLHWNCRSTSVPIVKSWQELGSIRTGGRPTDAEGIFKNRLKEKGFSDEAIDGVMQNARASMDGQVPAKMSFEDWVKTKSSDFQDQVFGARRAQLFRDGKLTAKDLLSQEGRPLTLKQLAERAEDPIARVNRLTKDLTKSLDAMSSESSDLQRQWNDLDLVDKELWKKYRTIMKIEDPDQWEKTKSTRVDLANQMSDLGARKKKIRQQLETQRVEARYVVLETLSTGKKATIPIQWRPMSTAKKIPEWRTQVEEGLSLTRQLFGNQFDPKASEVMGIYKMAPSERSHFSPWGSGSISMSGPGQKTMFSTVHEMGHWLEYRSSRVKKLATDFLKSRIGSSQPTWLGSGFGRNEIHVKDNFLDKYMGKIYPNYSSTEITSMGLEYLMKDPVKFLREDPEYFNLMIQILRGA